MNGGGFVKLWRKLLGHPAFNNDGEALAFAWLIMRASWKPTRQRYKGHTFHLQRGQLAISVRDAARHLERSRSWVERFWNRLKTETMIETHSETGVTVITVCNYSHYQDDERKAETPRETGTGTRPRQYRDTEQEGEEGEEGGRTALAADTPTKRTLIDPNFQPQPIGDLPPKAKAMAEQWPPGVYAAEAEEFVSYWLSEGKTKADWNATWRNNIKKVNHRVMQRAKANRGQWQGERPYHQLVGEGRA